MFIKIIFIKSHNFIFRDWNLNNPIQNWDYITVKNGRITTLNLHNNIIGTEDVKRLVLPSGLQTLYLSYNNIGADGAKGLVLPPGLKELYLSSNNIGDEGAKGLVLPPELLILYLSYNNIGDEGAKGLILPPKLKKLNLKHNNISYEGAKKMVLPPELQELDFQYNIIDIDEIFEQSNSQEGIKRYAPIQRYYDFKKCKPIWKEICRGLIFGKTEEPIFRFLQNIYGAKNIRYNILTFFNPFV